LKNQPEAQMKKGIKTQQENSQAVEVYLIIGNQNSGKSSATRALTGVRQIERQWQMLYAPGAAHIKTFVHPRSLQEAPKKTPSAFVAEVRKANVKKVIVALREASTGANFPNAQGYADHFERQPGWIIVAQAALNGATPVTTLSRSAVANIMGRPRATNAIAADIRKIWGLP
jgi:energy-coupling factor transporter ATP-binding protein EcfA2